MTGIFPTIAIGGVAVRDVAGAALAPPGVANIYSPPAAFSLSNGGAPFVMTLYGANCSVWQWDPAISNAFASEMLALTDAFDPTGTWEATSVVNMATAFQAWVAAHPSGLSADAGNTLILGTDSKIYLPADFSDGLLAAGLPTGAAIAYGHEHLFTDTGDSFVFLGAEGWAQLNEAGAPGTPGATGAPGAPGTNGAAGTAATVAVGTVTTLAMGAAPTVSNSGTSAAAVFDFGLAPGFVAAEATAFPVSPSLWEVVNRTDLAETFIYLPNGGSPIWRQL